MSSQQPPAMTSNQYFLWHLRRAEGLPVPATPPPQPTGGNLIQGVGERSNTPYTPNYGFWLGHLNAAEKAVQNRSQSLPQ